MHSSRLRTVHSSNHAYPSMHWAGGVSQHALGRGVSVQGGCLPREVSQHALGQTPPSPCEQNDRQV